LSKSCQKLQKLSKSCQTVVKQLSKSCQKVVTIGPSNPKLEKPENLKEEATTNRGVLDDEERRSDQEWTMKNGR
jgi:hypothetical protein